MPELKTLLEGYAAWRDLPVQWGDMDAAQHVNNTVYLRWFETGRIHFIDTRMDQPDFKGGSGPILAEQSCRYKLPVTYPDTITTACRIVPESIGQYDFQMQHIIISHKYMRIAAEGMCRVVWYDFAELRKTAIPDAVRTRLLERM
jgi:acyl-CoA thioester hydrolase